MKSKKSLCNTTLIRNDIHRFWPFLVAEVVLFLLFIVLPTFSSLSSYQNSNRFTEWDSEWNSARALIGGINNIASPFIPCVLAIVVAIFVFGYLNKEKEAYNLHALPIRRDTMFFSHYITGLLLLLIPTTVTFFFLGLLSGVFLHTIPVVLLYDFIIAIVETLFFFHLACFVMILSGNHFISIVVYAVINVLLPGLNNLFIWLRSVYIVNISDNGVGNWNGITRFTPLYFFSKRSYLPSYFPYAAEGKSVYQVLSELADTTALLQSIAYLIPTVILLLLALYLYQKRPVEAVGEMMVFSWAKPVFRVIFTVCGAMLFAEMIYYIVLLPLVSSYTYTQQFPVMVVLIILCGIVSYLLANAILYRSVHIIKMTSFLKCGILISIMVIVMFATRKPNYSIPTEHLINVAVDINLWDYEDEDYTDEDYEIGIQYQFDVKDMAVLSDIIRELKEIRQNQPADYSCIEMNGSLSFHLNYKDYSTDIYCDADSEHLSKAMEIIKKIGTRVYPDDTFQEEWEE